MVDKVAEKTAERTPEKVVPKHIFVTGGVVSSLGKGITASSLGRLLDSTRRLVSSAMFPPLGSGQ